MFDNAVSEQNARFRQLVDIYLNKNRDKSKQSIAQFVGCSASQFSKHYNGQREISLEDLVKYAELFGVTTDYMLCITDARSSDLDKRAICDYTGLSEEVIDGLHSIKTRPFYYANTNLYKLVSKIESERANIINLLLNELLNELLYKGYVDEIMELERLSILTLSDINAVYIDELNVMIKCLENSNSMKEYKRNVIKEYGEIIGVKPTSNELPPKTVFLYAHQNDNEIKKMKIELNGLAYDIQQRFSDIVKELTHCLEVDDYAKEYAQKVKEAESLLTKFI